MSLSLLLECAIFRDEIENYFSCSYLTRRDRDYHMTNLVFRDDNDIAYCYSRASRRDGYIRKLFLIYFRLNPLTAIFSHVHSHLNYYTYIKERSNYVQDLLGGGSNSRWFKKTIFEKTLGKGAENQNGNLRWHLPLGARPPPP